MQSHVFVLLSVFTVQQLSRILHLREIIFNKIADLIKHILNFLQPFRNVNYEFTIHAQLHTAH